VALPAAAVRFSVAPLMLKVAVPPAAVADPPEAR
jgi:hypothetical protein